MPKGFLLPDLLRVEFAGFQLVEEIRMHFGDEAG